MTRASGKARRWPDVLIGLLVVLLLGGFAFLLVGQRPQPVAQAPTPATPPATEPAPEPITIPTAPGSDATGSIPAPVTPSTSPGEAGEAAPATTGTTPPVTDENTGTPADAPTTTPDTATAGAQNNDPAPTTEIPVVPAAPIEQAPPAGATATNPAQSEPADPPPSTPPPAATTVTPPPSAAPVATSERRTPLRSDYRVSLGSFATRRTAERLTEGVRDLGYTVYPIDLGDQVVAQIGPFPDEATARRALADIRRAYPGAVLYPPRGRSLRGDTAEPTPSPAPAAPDTNRPAATAPTSAAPALVPDSPAPPEAIPAPTPAPSTPTPPTPPAAAEPKASVPAASAPVYLQLGAFDQVESAQTLVAELRREGYTPTVNAPDGRKVTVLVGPFSGTALTNAETNLAAQGHDFFRVR